MTARGSGTDATIDLSVYGYISSSNYLGFGIRIVLHARVQDANGIWGAWTNLVIKDNLVRWGRQPDGSSFAGNSGTLRLSLNTTSSGTTIPLQIYVDRSGSNYSGTSGVLGSASAPAFNGVVNIEPPLTSLLAPELTPVVFANSGEDKLISWDFTPSSGFSLVEFRLFINGVFTASASSSDYILPGYILALSANRIIVGVTATVSNVDGIQFTSPMGTMQIRIISKYNSVTAYNALGERRVGAISTYDSNGNLRDSRLYTYKGDGSLDLEAPGEPENPSGQLFIYEPFDQHEGLTGGFDLFTYGTNSTLIFSDDGTIHGNYKNYFDRWLLTTKQAIDVTSFSELRVVFETIKRYEPSSSFQVGLIAVKPPGSGRPASPAKWATITNLTNGSKMRQITLDVSNITGSLYFYIQSEQVEGKLHTALLNPPQSE